MSNTDITSSCVVLLSEGVSLINCFVSSSSRSYQRQISSILCLSTVIRVSFGLIPKKKAIIASFFVVLFQFNVRKVFAKSINYTVCRVIS